MELFCGNSQRVMAIDCFCRGVPSLMFDGVQNVALSEEKVSTTAVTQGNLEILLAPNSIDLHQTKKQQDEILDCPSSSFPLRRTH